MTTEPVISFDPAKRGSDRTFMNLEYSEYLKLQRKAEIADELVEFLSDLVEKQEIRGQCLDAAVEILLKYKELG